MRSIVASSALSSRYAITYPVAGTAVAPHDEDFLVLDTGGNGAGFNDKGSDLHQHLGSVAGCGDVVCAAGLGGAFRSEDGGFTWKMIKKQSSR